MSKYKKTRAGAKKQLPTNSSSIDQNANANETVPTVPVMKELVSFNKTCVCSVCLADRFTIDALFEMSDFAASSIATLLFNEYWKSGRVENETVSITIDDKIRASLDGFEISLELLDEAIEVKESGQTCEIPEHRERRPQIFHVRKKMGMDDVATDQDSTTDTGGTPEWIN